jgi:hypothetical protein
MDLTKMIKINSNNEYELLKDPKYDTSFYIKLNKLDPSLLKSLMRARIILGGSVIDNDQTLHFKAFTVESYEQYQTTLQKKNGTKRFPYDITLRMAYFLAKQLKYLITLEEKCFYEFNPENIIVLDESRFAYISSTHLLELDETNMQIMRPFTIKNTKLNIDFVSPEFAKIRELPSQIHFKTIFYSLARLLMFSLTNENEFETIPANEEIERLLKPIRETKLYWLIKRCLDEDPEKRMLLLV